MRFKLRTLLILVAVLPPVIAGAWWGWSEARRYFKPPRMTFELPIRG